MSRVKKCSHTILDKNCPSCIKLQKEWTKKLEKSGFEDAERNEEQLKFYSSEFYSRDYPIEVRHAKQEYYQLATNFLEEYKFDTKLDKFVWENHSNGLSMRDITKLLKTKMRVATNRTDVNKVVTRLKTKMYDMYLSPKKDYRE